MSEFSQTPKQAAPKSRARTQQPLHAAQVAGALLRLRTVEAITGLSRSTIYAKLKAGEFVEPVRLGARCTRWKASDVQAWLAAQAA
jgi:predicted DNA-binding transcriptional regulator AlpA